MAGGVASSWYQAKIARDGEARQLAKSIKGELSALIEIAEARDYIAGLKNAIQYVESSGTPHIVSVSVRRDYTIVYAQNASKIGLLPGELPAQVAVVHTKLSAILEDFATLHEGGNDLERSSRWTASHCLEVYKELLSLMVTTLEQARTVISAIDAQYPKP